MNAHLLSPWLASRQKIGLSRLNSVRLNTEISNATDMCKFSNTVGIQGLLSKITESKNARKPAANSITMRKHILIVIERHELSRERVSSTAKCVQPPGKVLYRSLRPATSELLPCSLSVSVSEEASPSSVPSEPDSMKPRLSSRATPREFASRNLNRYRTNCCCVTNSAFSRPVARWNRSSTMASSSISKPRQADRAEENAFLSKWPADGQIFSHSSLMCRLITSRSSTSSHSRPLTLGCLRKCRTAAELPCSHSVKSASGKVSDGIRWFSMATCPERMSIIQSAGFSFAGIWKPRPSR
mmetsp:Transcript_4700/g.12627  ORF Transcript_4700/g.12627 Transcript_4700/m.12627 type:complete len:299 (-) Transcript_4700:90-986(-)